MNSSEEELFYCDFHIKSRLQIKFIFFPTNLALITLSERPHGRTKKEHPRGF